MKKHSFLPALVASVALLAAPPAVLYAGGYGSTPISVITSAQMVDPYVPVDGTMNVAGAGAFSGDLTLNGGVGALGFGAGETVVPADGTLNVTGSVQSSSSFSGLGMDITGGGSLRFTDNNVKIEETGTNDMLLTVAGGDLTTTAATLYGTGVSIEYGILGGNSVTRLITASRGVEVSANNGVGIVATHFGYGPAQAVTGTNDGAGTQRAITLTQTKSYVEIDCQDTDGCTLTLSETNSFSVATPEGVMLIVKVLAASVGAVTVADSAGVQLVAGASISLGDDDQVTFIYDGTQWGQLSAVVDL